MKNILEHYNKYWVAPTIAIVGGLLGLYFSVVKQKLENQATNLANTATRIETELKEREFTNTLKIQMYSEVKDAIAKKDKQLQNAVLLIVNEMLEDDSLFRDKLITILLSSPNTDDSVRVEQQRMEDRAVRFRKEETQIAENKFTIDVFMLEDLQQEAAPRVDRIIALLTEKFPNYQIRKRILPRSINARSGYRVAQNEIRFEAEEEPIARQVHDIILANHVFQFEQPRLKMITHKTPNYISVFVRNM